MCSWFRKFRNYICGSLPDVESDVSSDELLDDNNDADDNDTDDNDAYDDSDNDDD